MKAYQDPATKLDTLRRRAEELIQHRTDLETATFSSTIELIHELEIHQAELQIQNEELKRTQLELSELHREYARLYEFAPCGYVILDTKGIITHVNLTGVKLLGTPRRYLLHSGLSQYIAEDWQGAYLAARQKATRTGENQRVELLIKRQNAPALWVRADIQANRDDNDAVYQWFITMVDITQEKEAKEGLNRLNETLEQQVSERTSLAESRAKLLQTLTIELIEAEERERRRIADHLHDDLQQMLVAARMQIESVNKNRPSDSILSNIEQLLEESISKSRLMSYELSPPVLQHANLAAALHWLGKYYDEQFGLKVELQIDESLQAENEPIKMFLFRAVQELLFNVVKHADSKSARVDFTRNDGCLALTVSDQGRGLNPHILDAAAAPSGIGLLSLRERARYIGGSLVIESPGTGSRVTIELPFSIGKAKELPRSEALRKANSPVEEACTAGSGDISVLFVDDHKVMRQGLINLFSTQPGIHVAGEASNGREAIDRVRQLNPDVVIMDVSMPEMDGIEATRHIKTNWPEVRVIGLSMFEDEHVSRAMQEAGAETLVSKTASSTELFKAVFGIDDSVVENKRCQP